MSTERHGRSPEYRRPLYTREPIRDVMALTSRTGCVVEHAERMCKAVDEYRTDARKDERVKAKKCRACYYICGRGGLSVGPISVNCRQCDAYMHTDSGNPYDVCAECADKYAMCQRCGGDIDGSERRRKMEKGPRS